jgi:uncharacterized pyridoxamine 5'-phosphate oxidase family protein
MSENVLSDELIAERTERAKWLLANIKHAAMATVNADGSPHNTPYFFMASSDLTKIYWGSHPESEHSKNILRTGQLFVVLYEANISGGLYIRATNGRIARDNELAEALDRHNQLRGERYDKYPLAREYYEDDGEQKMWIADTQQFWVNGSSKDLNSAIVQDYRYEIRRPTLF